jgi:AraC family transcriptional regulator
MRPVDPDISLALFTGGAMRLEWRERQSAWTGRTLRPGDLVLRPGACQSYEMRWHSLSPAPTHRLLVYLSQELFACAAGDVAGADPACMSVVERVGFRDPLLSQIALALWRELEARSRRRVCAYRRRATRPARRSGQSTMNTRQ